MADEQRTTEMPIWNCFCCELIDQPGWGHGSMADLMKKPKDADTSIDECCFTSTYSVTTTDARNNSGVVEVDTQTCGGFCTVVDYSGLWDATVYSGLFGLLTYGHGSNNISRWCTASIVGVGAICARGEHHGCGVSAACLGCFCGNTSRYLQTLFFGSGWKTY